MTEKTQPGTYVSLGFGVCALLLCVMSVVGYNGIVMQQRAFEEHAMQTEAGTQIHHAARQFDAMRRSTERFRQTGDEKLLTDQHFQEAVVALEEACYRFSSPENKKLTDMLQKQLEDHRRLSDELVMLSQKQREISNEASKSSEMLDKRLHEAVQANKEWQPLLDIAGRLKLNRVKAMTAPTEQAREECRKRLEEQFDEFHKRAQETRKKIEIPENAKKLDELMAHADNYRQTVHESLQWHHESEHLRNTADRLAAETEERFEELQKRMEERRCMEAEHYAAVSTTVIHMLIICSIVSLIFCLFTCFFVSRKLQPKRGDMDPYAPPPENSNRNLSVVADKLQEVVDLLRH